MTSKSPFARFFRSVKGALVSRYGAPPGNYIGANVGKDGPAWSDDITAITNEEASRYAREYDRAVRDRSLVEVKASVYEAQAAKHLAAEKKAAEEAAKKNKEAAQVAEGESK